MEGQRSSYRPSLVLYVVWDPQFDLGQVYAEQLYSRFTRDIRHPVSRGTGIPVFFRATPLPGKDVPPEIVTDCAQHSAVIVLVENGMVNSEPWNDYLEGLWKQMKDARCPHRLYLVSITQHAFNLRGDIPKSQFIRLHDRPQGERRAYLERILTHELCRLLLNRTRITAITEQEFSPAPVKLFISHAKQDGLRMAEAIRDFIHQQLPLKTFFDTTDIAVGYSFEGEIQAHLEDASLLAIQTDSYAGREWCRREVVAAKQLGIPIVAVNAVADGEERSFPYLGNIPTIRWSRASLQLDAEALKRDIESTIDLMLSEVLRRGYWRHSFEDLRNLGLLPKGATCLSRPPELLDLIKYHPAPEQDQPLLLVYPDPPLGTTESEVLSLFVPGLKLMTPVLIWSGQ